MCSLSFFLSSFLGATSRTVRKQPPPFHHLFSERFRSFRHASFRFITVYYYFYILILLLIIRLPRTITPSPFSKHATRRVAGKIQHGPFVFARQFRQRLEIVLVQKLLNRNARMMLMMMITTTTRRRGSVAAVISLLVFIKIVLRFSIEVPSIQLIDSARVIADVHSRERDEKRRVLFFSRHTRRRRKSCRRRLCFLLVLRVVFSSLLSSRIFSSLGKGRSFCLCSSSMSGYFEATITTTDRK